MGNNKISNVSQPTENTDVATKGYVDSAVASTGGSTNVENGLLFGVHNSAQSIEIGQLGSNQATAIGSYLLVSMTANFIHW